MLRLVLLLGSASMACTWTARPIQPSPTPRTLSSLTYEAEPAASPIATATQELVDGPTPFPTSLSQLPADAPFISPSNASDLVPLWGQASEEEVLRVGWPEDERLIGIGGVAGIEILEFPNMSEYGMVHDGLYDFAFTQVFDWQILMVASQGSVKMWDLTLLKPIEGYRDPEDMTLAGRLALSADGQRLAASAFQESGGEQHTVVHIWDVESGMKLLTIQPGGSALSGALEFRPDGTELATADWFERIVSFWDAGTGDLLGSVQGANVRYSPDGDFIATAAIGSVWIWIGESRRLIRELEVNSEELIVPIAFSPDGALFAAGKDRITIWKTENWVEITSLSLPGGALQSLQFSPSGRYLASVSGQKSFDTGDLVQEYFVTIWAVDS